MNNSIKTNLKSITKNTVSIPVEAAALSIELAADAANLSMATLRGTVPATKQVGTIFGKFITGMLNSDKSIEEVETIFKETTLSTVMNNVEKAAIKAGQDMASEW